MHAGVPWLIYIGGILLIVTMVGWWKDVIAEANDGSSHSSPVKAGLRVGFLLFIASEVMFFFAFFWAYFHSSLPILNIVAGPWPPKGIDALGAAGIPMLNTLLLLTSSLTVTVAHHAILEDDRQKVILWTGITVILGILFLGVQIGEYMHLAFGLVMAFTPRLSILPRDFMAFMFLWERYF